MQNVARTNRGQSNKTLNCVVSCYQISKTLFLRRGTPEEICGETLTSSHLPHQTELSKESTLVSEGQDERELQRNHRQARWSART